MQYDAVASVTVTDDCDVSDTIKILNTSDTGWVEICQNTPVWPVGDSGSKSCSGTSKLCSGGISDMEYIVGDKKWVITDLGLPPSFTYACYIPKSEAPWVWYFPEWNDEGCPGWEAPPCGGVTSCALEWYGSAPCPSPDHCCCVFSRCYFYMWECP